MDNKTVKEQSRVENSQQANLRVHKKMGKTNKCERGAQLVAITFLGLILGCGGGYLLGKSNTVDNPDTPDGSFFCAYSDGTFAGKGDANSVNRNWHVKLTNCGGWLNMTSQVQSALPNTFETAQLALFAHTGLDFCDSSNPRTAYCAFLDSNPANQTDNLGSFTQNVWNALHNGNAKAVNLKYPKTKRAKIPKNKREFFHLNQGRKR